MRLWLALILACIAPYASAGSYPPDPVCQTLGRTSRDPAMNENVYLRKRDQQCKIPLKGGGISLYTYSLNQVSVPVIERGLVFISAPNLDTGTTVSDSASVYAIKLGGQQAVAGMVLGSSLGGSGVDPANIVPMSSDARSKWQAFEAAIYKCIRGGQSTSAKLRWIFSYRSKTETRPYAIEYSATFHGGPNNCQQMVQVFDT
jgi:hypothetical protein